jgi:ribosomal protein S18 acetylase RimI-like enzyme
MMKTYICKMDALLDNPVYNALTTGDAALARGSGQVRYFDEAVSPFAGFPERYEKGFEDLCEQLPPERRILFAAIHPIQAPRHWEIAAYIRGVQFVFDTTREVASPSIEPTPLSSEHVDEMVQLATLTKPGPFNKRTIGFGSYYGIFEDGRLSAMTGQRLHVSGYTEVSAVCTHPDFLGRGYATALLQHQLLIILNQKQTPFLHVRDDNKRAIGVYERLGFRLRGPMHFYFLRRSGR